MVYSGYYPYTNSRWECVRGLSEAEVKDLGGFGITAQDIKYWCNKAFKMLPDSLDAYLEKRHDEVKAIYEHDGYFYLIRTSKKEAIVAALKYEKEWYENQARNLACTIQKVCGGEEIQEEI